MVSRLTDLSGRGGNLGRSGDLATDGDYLYFIWEEAMGGGDIWVMDVVTDESK